MAFGDCNCNSQAGPCSTHPCTTETIPSQEPLPSALENFILAFFGTLTKTQNPDGTWTWTLPCNLTEGLPANPRLPDEGVSCYLLRLINDGISGLQGEPGPEGPAGVQGDAGDNAWSITGQAFVEPAINTNVSILLVNANFLATGVNFFVETSGYYLVVGKLGNVLNAKFIASIGGPGGSITAGKLVHAAGPQGNVGPTGAVGPAGAAGPAGPAGAAGPTGPSGNKFVFVFQRSASAPATPTGNNVPAGWSAAPPVGSDPLWLSTAEQTSAGVTVGVWSTPFSVSDETTGQNLGTGAEVFKDKSGDVMRFRTIVGSNLIDVIQSGDEIIIDDAFGAEGAALAATETPSEARIELELGVNYPSYASGTPYALTNVSAALDFGTADPSITILEPGRYSIRARVHIKANAATVVAETLSLKLRRTNNTPADIAETPTTFFPPAITTSTHSVAVIELPEVIYETLNSDDVLTIFGNVSATLGAGTLDAIEASIVAIRIR